MCIATATLWNVYTKTWSRTSLIENKYNQCVNATRSLNSEYERNKWKDRYTRCSILFPNYSQSCAKYALIRKNDRINSWKRKKRRMVDEKWKRGHLTREFKWIFLLFFYVPDINAATLSAFLQARAHFLRHFKVF